MPSPAPETPLQEFGISSAFHYKDYKSCESEIELVPAERDWGFVELGNALEDALFEFRL